MAELDEFLSKSQTRMAVALVGLMMDAVVDETCNVTSAMTILCADIAECRGQGAVCEPDVGSFPFALPCCNSADACIRGPDEKAHTCQSREFVKQNIPGANTLECDLSLPSEYTL